MLRLLIMRELALMVILCLFFGFALSTAPLWCEFMEGIVNNVMQKVL